MSGEVLATVTITKTATDDDVAIYVDACVPDGQDDLPLTETLGMIELAKSILLSD